MKKVMSCVLVVVSAAMTAIAVVSCSATSEPSKPKAAVGPDWDGVQPISECVNPGNKVFYKEDGSFDEAATKEAYFAMMRAHGYPISATLTDKKGLWVCDFLSRDHEKMGMGGVFWINESGVYGESGTKAKYVAKRKAGDVYKLCDPESWHFMRAGKNGAIVTEYATYHNHVEFSNPEAKFECSKAKK